jgi:ribonuclease P protein component
LTAAFPPSARLRQPREFEAVLARGRRYQEKWLSVAVLNNDLDHARLGLAISARAVPAATARNRIKRQARESFRVHRAALPPCDIVMLARAGAGAAATRDLRAQLERLWRRLPAES